MTAQELIKALQTCPPDSIVEIWDDEAYEYVELEHDEVRYNFQYRTVELK